MFNLSPEMMQALQQQRAGQFQGQGFDFSGAPAGTAGGTGEVGGAGGFGFDFSGMDLGEFLEQHWRTLAQFGLPAVGAIWDQFSQSPREKLEKEILQARKERLGDLQRQARGDFTPGERAFIQRANEPIMNRVASNLAQRGLSNSGAAAAVLAQAEQAPFLQAQQQAQVQMDAYELQTFKLAHELIDEDDNFMADLSRGFRASAHRQALGSADVTEGQFNQLMTQLSEAAAEYEAIIEGFEGLVSDLKG